MAHASDTPAGRLKAARKQQNMPSAELAKLVGFSVSTIRAHETSQNQIRPEAAQAYADALRTTPEWILYGTRGVRGEPAQRLIPVLGTVRAGAWFEQLAIEPEPIDHIPFWDPQFERAKDVFALIVAGTSFNRFYQPGTIVYCVATVEAGVREGDHVVAHRHRNGLVEATLKEVVYNAAENRIELWPRSTDPNHQEPLIVPKEPDADNGVEIKAVVIGSYNKTPRSRGQLLF